MTASKDSIIHSDSVYWTFHVPSRGRAVVLDWSPITRPPDNPFGLAIGHWMVSSVGCFEIIAIEPGRRAVEFQTRPYVVGLIVRAETDQAVCQQGERVTFVATRPD